MKGKNMKFKCRKCGSDSLEEEVVEINTYQKISDVTIDKDGKINVEYLPVDYTSLEGGSFSRYICADCGETIATSLTELVEQLGI